jgi:hypothetical protein
MKLLVAVNDESLIAVDFFGNEDDLLKAFKANQEETFINSEGSLEIHNRGVSVYTNLKVGEYHQDSRFSVQGDEIDFYEAFAHFKAKGLQATRDGRVVRI